VEFYCSWESKTIRRGNVSATHLEIHIKQTRGLLWIGILKVAEENVCHDVMFCEYSSGGRGLTAWEEMTRCVELSENRVR
jgi:hypothetical protein